VAEAARELGIELLQPASVNDDAARERIAAAAPGAVCVCAFGALIKEPLLCEHRMLNVHPSLLPRWRGAAPIERAIMAGDEETGVSIMRVTAGLDSGPVCLQATEPIHPDDTYGTLAARLERLGGDLLVQALDTEHPLAEQDEAAATYADKIGSDDRTLDPTDRPDELERTVRALQPHIVTRIALPGGEWLGVHAAAVAGAGEEAPPPGDLAVRGGRLLFGCAGGALELRVVQPPGARAMDAADFLRGHRLPGS
ncbi:MAG: methionyl-tRNA formyltransferase, partial [Actinomycetota bacterium]|nr:methionyl-tRNA formyltransferase [Actinomycetota bacterium]